MTTTVNFDITDIQSGDVFSESSHYVYVCKNVDGSFRFKHLESKNEVNLTKDYVESLLATADQFANTVTVGKENKLWTAKQLSDAGNTVDRPGDVKIPGIRTIWDNIHSSQVFTVAFYKQDKKKTKKDYQNELDNQLLDAINKITAAQKGKRGVANVAGEVIKEIQKNPISDVIPGELREMRGYKAQFSSITGFYDVYDMDINDLRKVNVNEIQWLVIDNTKYIVE